MYLKLKQYELAKEHLYEEIRHGGNLDGAYSNLGRTLLETKEYDELDRLIGTPKAREHVPGGIIRLNHLVQGEYGQVLSPSVRRDKPHLSRVHLRVPYYADVVFLSATTGRV